MLIQQKEEQGKGKFYVEEDGNTVAELVYSTPSPDKMIIKHTEVDDSLSGRGVGKQLVQAAVEHARKHNKKIIPRCTFTKSVFDREPEWQDVLQRIDS
jgi:predicted GNAT family acetyltransferase